MVRAVVRLRGCRSFACLGLCPRTGAGETYETSLVSLVVDRRLSRADASDLADLAVARVRLCPAGAFLSQAEKPVPRETLPSLMCVVSL